MGNPVEPGASDTYWIDICACGHVVDRHTLLGTEYCRCENYPGECPCAGGARVALRVLEDVGLSKRLKLRSRFFRRQFHPASPHPLNAGVKKLEAELGTGFIEWAPEECDLCGSSYDVEEGLTAYWVGASGEAVVEVSEVTGRTLLVCNKCVLDILWEHDAV